MPILNVEGVTHWSIPVNDLEEGRRVLWGVAGTGPGGTIREQHHVVLQRWVPLDRADWESEMVVPVDAGSDSLEAYFVAGGSHADIERGRRNPLVHTGQ